MAKWRAIYDVDPKIKDQGATFMHCKKCMETMPDGQSPKTWARQQMAIRTDGKFQLRCTRHDINIAVISIEENDDDRS